MSAGLGATHKQENYFFDGPASELNSKRTVLRLRFYDVDKKAVITIKVRGFSPGAPAIKHWPLTLAFEASVYLHLVALVILNIIPPSP